MDFLVEDKIILEIKQGNYIPKRNLEQIIRYLNVTGLKLAIIANFTSKGAKFLRAFNSSDLNNK